MKYYGLAVGINDFPGTQNDLSGCVNDAVDISRLLSRSVTGRDSIARSPFFHCFNSVKVLLDQKAKLKNAVNAVTSLLSKLGDDDFAFLWFSQHGTYVKDENGDEPDGTDEALVFADFGLWVDDDIYDALTNRNPNSKVFIGTDSCHSGTVHRLYTPPVQPKTKVRFLPASHFPEKVRPIGAIRRKRPKADQPPIENVIHFAGCQDTEYCYDASFGRRPNGAFTYYLIKALSTLKPGATFGDWFDALRNFLPSVQYGQTPKCNATSGSLSWPIPLKKG